MKNYLIFLIPILCFVASCDDSSKPNPPLPPYTSDKVLVDDSAMVVCAHPLASDIGADVLRKGGHAVDALVAVHFALAVVYPAAGNLGGGGFMVYRDKDGHATTLDYREMAPDSAHRDMYLDEKGEAVAEWSRRGHLSVGVPGSVDGMVRAHQKYGKLSWAELIEPAIELAENGFLMTEKEAQRCNKSQEEFVKYNRHTPVFVKEGGWKMGDKMVQKELAATLRLIRDKGRAGFYEGKTAALFLDEMKAKGGIITAQDLLNYESKWREPVRFKYKDYDFISMPPPSSGGVVLGQILNMLENQQLSDFHDATSTHLIIEAERRAYADRAEHLGDSDFYPVPLAELLDKKYAQQRFADFNPNQATSSDSIGAGDPLAVESEETTHISIIDVEGNAVSTTTTINSSYGSKVVVKGAGFLLNNEMDDFSAKPGVPNDYGLVGAEANAIQPRKRMLSSMTPTIIERDSALFLVVGTPGGSTIITSVLQVFLNLTEFDLSLEKAVHQPRFHHQWLPQKVFYEEGAFDEATLQKLTEMGHTMEMRKPDNELGRVEAILVRRDGKLEGVADIRRDDDASGF